MIPPKSIFTTIASRFLSHRFSLVVGLAVGILATSLSGYAQNEGTLHFMNSLPQSVYNNPAFMPKHRFSIGLPGSSVFIHYANNNGLTYDKVVEEEQGKKVVDLAKLVDRLPANNYTTLAAQADVFRLSIRIGPRFHFTYNSTTKAYARLLLPKDVATILVNGTTPYVNSTASLSPKAEGISYVEHAFGGAYRINKDFTIGARFKLLTGFINFTTTTSQLDLSLDENYGITLQGALDARSSGVNNLDDFDMDNYNNYLDNRGFAADLGATYRLKDRFMVGLSVIDLGRITWKNDLYGYTLSPDRANYTFQGIDLNRVLNDEENYLDADLDSLEKRFEPSEGIIGSYSTPLPTKIYLSGAYELKRNFSVGALFFAEQFRGRFAPGFTASLNKNFGRRVGASVSYTMNNRSFNNIGAGLSLNFAPIQFYLVGDNLLRAPLVQLTQGKLNPYINNLQVFNLRLGLNFIFGWEKVQEHQPYQRIKKKLRQL
jgi:hypothetical protein